MPSFLPVYGHFPHYPLKSGFSLRVGRLYRVSYFALYEAYGTRPYEWGDDPDRQKANTKEEESDLNLLNEGMRYRDLETGTFLTRDPIGYADGPNIYCYVHCNPITNFDPLGLKWYNPVASDFILWGAAKSTVKNVAGVYTGPKYYFNEPKFAAYEISSEGSTEVDKISTEKVFSNGIMNNRRTAEENAVDHTEANLSTESVTLLHNPSHGFVADTIESGMGLLFGPSSVAKQQAAMVEAVPADQKMDWVAHSQAGITTKNSSKIMSENGNNAMANVTLTFHGAAIGTDGAKKTAARIGANYGGYDARPSDPVSQVVGLDGNPMTMAWSLFNSPRLFLGPSLSQHSKYPSSKNVEKTEEEESSK